MVLAFQLDTIRILRHVIVGQTEVELPAGRLHRAHLINIGALEWDKLGC